LFSTNPRRGLTKSDHPLDEIEPLPLDMFAVRRVNPAANKVTKDIAAIEAA
jgi:hypothetical protein